jgi:hypothetical protein
MGRMPDDLSIGQRVFTAIQKRPEIGLTPLLPHGISKITLKVVVFAWDSRVRVEPTRDRSVDQLGRLPLGVFRGVLNR